METSSNENEREYTPGLRSAGLHNISIAIMLLSKHELWNKLEPNLQKNWGFCSH